MIAREAGAEKKNGGGGGDFFFHRERECTHWQCSLVRFHVRAQTKIVFQKMEGGWIRV